MRNSILGRDNNLCHIPAWDHVLCLAVQWTFDFDLFDFVRSVRTLKIEQRQGQMAPTDVFLYKRKGTTVLCFVLLSIWLANFEGNCALHSTTEFYSHLGSFSSLFYNCVKREGESRTLLQFVRRIMPLAEHLQQFAPFVCASFVHPQERWPI